MMAQQDKKTLLECLLEADPKDIYYICVSFHELNSGESATLNLDLIGIDRVPKERRTGFIEHCFNYFNSLYLLNRFVKKTDVYKEKYLITDDSPMIPQPSTIMIYILDD